MKKSITFIALICALASLTACGDKNTAADTQSTISTASASYIVDSESSGEEAKASEGNTQSEAETTDNRSDTGSIAEESTSSKTESEASSTSVTSSETESESIIEEDTEYVVSAEEVESSLSGYESEITGQWTAQYILDNQGNEIGGEEIYGTAYKQYGGTMLLNSDGTFSVKMGVNTDDESTKGTFTYNGGSEISLLYYNDTTIVCELCTIDGNKAIAMPIELFGDVFTVYFTMQ